MLSWCRHPRSRTAAPGRRGPGRKNRMATMVDVARSAGVSVATVSHVLNDTRPVRPATRQAVLDAIDELGYTPNTLARSLVTSRTRSIGLAVSAISNPYFTEILQGVEAGALERGYSLLIADPHDDPVHERKVVQLLHERRVDGMIVAPSADPEELVGYLGAARRTDGVPGPAGRQPGRPVHVRPGLRGERRARHAPGQASRRAGPQRIGLVAGLPGLEHHQRADLRLPARPARTRDSRTTSVLVVPGNSEAAGAERATRPAVASRRRPPHSSPPTTR